MCGFTGFLPLSKKIEKKALENKIQGMNSAIHHRGPNDHGIFCDDQTNLSMGFQRLSILDLSKAGAQPMISRSERYVLVYNGEIYNFRDLKSRLENHYPFRGNSDSEVLLAAFECWGIEKTLQSINGMFAIALYDRHNQTLTLIRDRIGQKPLYFGWGEDGFYFASEIKAVVKSHPGPLTLNKNVAALYLQWRYIPDPYCIYEGFWKLPPGHLITLPLENWKTAFDAHDYTQPYWDFKSIARDTRPFAGTQNQAIDTLDELISQATQLRMVSDVPLGGFLSGGIDSSLICAMMQKNQPVQTITIGFDDPQYNEATHAKAIAGHLGTQHQEITLSPRDALDCVARLPSVYDEPFGDPSAIPTYLLCREAKKSLAVALSGDGGDESFGGYSWYRRAQTLQNIRLKSLLAKFLCFSPQQKKLASVLRSQDPQTIYKNLHSYWQILPQNVLRFVPEYLPLPHDRFSAKDDLNETLMGFDNLMFLAGDVLTKIDRASMAHSFEVRNPLLDPSVVAFAWSLPPHMRRQKKLLKSLLERYVPQELFNRPKQGFSIPHGQWLRTDLREWADALLDTEKLEASGLFNPEPIRKIWQSHLQKKSDYGHLLWTIVMFQSWHDHWMER
jgi:asparagine synthase (glutamine-hydrolysing)